MSGNEGKTERFRNRDNVKEHVSGVRSRKLSPGRLWEYMEEKRKGKAEKHEGIGGINKKRLRAMSKRDGGDTAKGQSSNAESKKSTYQP